MFKKIRKIGVYILVFSLFSMTFFEVFRPFSVLSQTNVSVSATVATSITCNFSTTTTAFGNIDTSAVFTSSPNVTTTISCNPGAGCNITVRDQGDGTNGGLYKSSAPTYLIPSPAAGFPATANLTAGTDGYGIQAATTSAGSGGILTLNSIYNQTGNTVGRLSTTSVELASSSQPVSNRQVVITHRAAVGGLAPAGSYSDTITYQCVSN
ncbi:MAG: hypothetical protein NZ822_01775 [Patescibacteria group bacterium]|nr:hypothetical protein [Patescibacteria group bacterium]